ncbi:MAG: hypothetical protein RBT51_07080 [Ectothiorhodospiraceae bacterium]|nr:hypothetical protein [Ectothiorhodospiraceae bacterium]
MTGDAAHGDAIMRGRRHDVTMNRTGVTTGNNHLYFPPMRRPNPIVRLLALWLCLLFPLQGLALSVMPVLHAMPVQQATAEADPHAAHHAMAQDMAHDMNHGMTHDCCDEPAPPSSHDSSCCNGADCHCAHLTVTVPRATFALSAAVSALEPSARLPSIFVSRASPPLDRPPR